MRCPTRVATINGRWACDGPADLPAIHALQDATTLTPLDPGAPAPAGLPDVSAAPTAALTFFEKFRVWSQAFTPAPHDAELQASLAPLGLTGQQPVTDAGADVLAALEQGYADGQTLLAARLRGGHAEVVNGWQLAFHAFDYNLDFYEVGAVDSPRWKITDPTERLVTRAAAALGGLWGNNAYEAAYLPTYVDDRGEQLVARAVTRSG